MMSGGEEGVLVYWNLNRGTRAFLPRLGGPISCVQPDTHGAYCAVAVQDNRVIVVRLADWAVQWQVSIFNQLNLHVMLLNLSAVLNSMRMK
jgi:NET1-associated nuclear protein 1 (U3 small nucleolar RNA-associated protein 17)